MAQVIYLYLVLIQRMMAELAYQNARIEKLEEQLRAIHGM